MISPTPPIPSSQSFSFNNSLYSQCTFLTSRSSSKCTLLPEDIQLQVLRTKGLIFFHSQIGNHSVTTCILSHTSCFYPFSLCHGQFLHFIHQRRIHACRRVSVPQNPNTGIGGCVRGIQWIFFLFSFRS